MSDLDFPAIFNQAHGFLSIEEAKLLYALASQVPVGGTIVEIGSYQGRSTVLLGLGAKEAGARLYSVDPHEEYDEGDTHYGMTDNQHYYENLVKFDVGSVVRTLNIHAGHMHSHWLPPIDLLFIDGSHKYDDVSDDLFYWSKLTFGKIAIHDTAGHHPDVTRALADFMRDNEQWTIVQQVDAIAVLERVE